MAKKLKPVENEGVEKPIDEGILDAPEDGIGSRLRAAREARGFSQTAVATRTKMQDPKGQGVSRTVILSYEAGKFKPGARELRMLCEVLSVTPNWLIYGSDSAHEAAQASMETVRKNDAVSAFRLALAISVLKHHERGAFSSLVLSMAGREMGDLRLSSLLYMGKELAEKALKELEASFREMSPGESLAEKSLLDLVKSYSESIDTNFGNKLSFNEEGEGPFGEWLYKETIPKE